jgi:phytoene dehydrogenase-like protein
VTYDVIVVGAGHNGLIVAAYLARAGQSVCVLEASDIVGGAAASRQLTLPGFIHDPGATVHMTMQANPMIHRDELGLRSKYGLKYIAPDPQLAIVFPDDSALVFYRDLDKTCESIAQFSRKDADMYRKFVGGAGQLLKAGGVATFSPAAPFGRLISLMDQSDMGREYLRVILSSTTDLAKEWFESEQMRIALNRWASEVMFSPQELGTGYYMFGLPHFHAWGIAWPEGGSGALTEKLAACIRDSGGTIRVSTPVKAVRVSGGEVKGVVTESGEEIAAKKAVVSNVNVKQLFLDFMKATDLPEGFQDKVRRIRHSPFSAINQSIALKEAPRYKAGGDVDRAVMVELTPPNMDDFLRLFDQYKYGIPNTAMPLLIVATHCDPSRAPAGRHTLYLYHYEPYNLKPGGASRWDSIKNEIADGILETVRQRTTNMGADNILGRHVMSPLDLERYNPAMIEGDVMHIGVYLSQFLTNRPLPGWGQYRTPVKKLYMCGASTHPGGGVSGGGRAVAQVIMEDMDIDFKKVVGK